MIGVSGIVNIAIAPNNELTINTIFIIFKSIFKKQESNAYNTVQSNNTGRNHGQTRT